MAMKAGRIMESAIAEAVREEHPDWLVEKADKYYRDPVLRIGATPDYFRVILGDTPLQTKKWPIECKFIQPSVYAKDWGAGPPLMYVLQTLTQMYITGAEHGYVACMVDNRAKDVFIYDVPRNDAAWKKICDRVARFWEDVASGTMPDANYTVDGAALKDMYPANADATPLDLREDNRLTDLLAKRERLAEALKVMKVEQEAIDAEIIDKLKGAPAAQCNGYRISYKQQTRKSYVVADATFSVMRVTKTKEESAL
jgi:predicted phage-related endonuclease